MFICHVSYRKNVYSWYVGVVMSVTTLCLVIMIVTWWTLFSPLLGLPVQRY